MFKGTSSNHDRAETLASGNRANGARISPANVHIGVGQGSDVGKSLSTVARCSSPD